MPGLRSTVRVDNFFPQFRRQIDRLAYDSVAAGARVGGEICASVASQRSKSGHMADIRIGSPSSTGTGYEASFISPTFYSWMQNYGTLGNRKKPLKQAPRTHRTRAPGTGVTPLRHLDIGRRGGRNSMLDVIARGLPR